VIASEDGQFVSHRGVDWRSLEAAWRRHQRPPAAAPSGSGSADGAGAGAARVVGGSTLTQQLAKNLFLSGERTLWRKGQELVLALALEAMLDKQRLLELYLNHVEWGEGVFGAEAAAQRYFQRPALALDARQSARLAVMLPAPRRFEKQPDSAYLNQRTQVILGRMQAAQIPPAR
jgi:monofunctional biosynthetic peptidoglycan transglycosylase